MAIYRKGENQFGLHESARLGQNKRQMDKSKAMEDMYDMGNPLKIVAASDFMTESIAREISYEAALEDITVGQHKTQNNAMNAIAKAAGMEADLSIPISGDDLARGAAGKKALKQLDY